MIVVLSSEAWYLFFISCLFCDKSNFIIWCHHSLHSPLSNLDWCRKRCFLYIFSAWDDFLSYTMVMLLAGTDWLSSSMHIYNTYITSIDSLVHTYTIYMLAYVHASDNNYDNLYGTITRYNTWVMKLWFNISWRCYNYYYTMLQIECLDFDSDGKVRKFDGQIVSSSTESHLQRWVW